MVAICTARMRLRRAGFKTFASARSLTPLSLRICEAVGIFCLSRPLWVPVSLRSLRRRLTQFLYSRGHNLTREYQRVPYLCPEESSDVRTEHPTCPQIVPRDSRSE